jgi:hypothetical protein
VNPVSGLVWEDRQYHHCADSDSREFICRINDVLALVITANGQVILDIYGVDGFSELVAFTSVEEAMQEGERILLVNAL